VSAPLRARVHFERRAAVSGTWALRCVVSGRSKAFERRRSSEGIRARSLGKRRVQTRGWEPSEGVKIALPSGPSCPRRVLCAFAPRCETPLLSTRTCVHPVLASLFFAMMSAVGVFMPGVFPPRDHLLFRRGDVLLLVMNMRSS